MPAFHVRAFVVSLSLLAAIAAPSVRAQEREQPIVENYTVFVDPPTAFAFIKLPAGWKFIGKLDVSQLRHLPPGTVTSLLPPDIEPVHVAARLARQPARP